MSQLLAQAGPYPLTKTWYVGGTATDVGDVTIGVIDGNGDVIVAALTATTNNNDGTYDYTLADQPDPDQLTITWTRTDTGADLVDRTELLGNWLFIEAEARAFRGKADAATANVPLANEAEYPDDVIADERQRILEDFENWTGRAFVPRYCRVELMGNGHRVLSLSDGIPRTSDGYALNRPGRLYDPAFLLTVTINGTLATLSNYVINANGAQIASEAGAFSAATSANRYNVVVEYVYGSPYPVDGADRMAMMLLVDRLVPSAFPDRALSVDTDFGTTRFVQPGGPMMNVSRVPEVNEWVKSHNGKILVG